MVGTNVATVKASTAPPAPKYSDLTTSRAKPSTRLATLPSEMIEAARAIWVVSWEAGSVGEGSAPAAACCGSTGPVSSLGVASIVVIGRRDCTALAEGA